MTKKILPTPEQLRELLTYDPETGKLFWKPRDISYFYGKHCPARQISVWNARFLGKEAFTSLNKSGYKDGYMFGRTMKAHRVAWAIFYGYWPKDKIDHINCIKDDNRISNLRECNNSENLMNSGKRSINKSGFKGVSWDSEVGKWRAQICVRGKKISIGRYDCPEAAYSAYCAAAIKHHGEFARVS